MKRESALCAEKISDATNTASLNAVPVSVPLNFVGITAVRSAGREPVYNMEVDGYHNFSVNGGVIVHNCMDMTRYFCNTIMRREVRESGI